MTESTSEDREDRRKHLDFIQAIITRMSTASSNTKAWFLPVATAAFGYAIAQNNPWVAMLGVGATILAAYIDANYLRQEKAYRAMYRVVAKGDETFSSFCLQPDELPDCVSQEERGSWSASTPHWFDRLFPGPSVWRSWSIVAFYLPIFITGSVVSGLLFCK
ncbi:hypothetical protein [Corynebacterium sp. NML130628]|uniref:hypothetical protein n=1 Tax=Corynebacterium sp. NML130628 TaxID=1906333 RepID=UPI0008FB3044|nr:hypothetical protein [Corynebacterium sp. NML130628]OIR42722.1 hypothetical protein BJP07_07345 [Corynebacterium sp. NML130628]